MTEQTITPTPITERQAVRPLGEVGKLVHDRVAALQRTGLTSATVAVLAQLRGAAGKEPGSVPAIWALTVDGVPGPRRDDNVASYEERAVHTALTLFALHQQARPHPMHVRGVGLGAAVAKLDHSRTEGGRADSDHTSAIRRRFDQIATAASFDEVAYHLRGLVGQLRQAQVALDYGQLADDLLGLQIPGGASRVRLAWARQYYRTTSEPAAGTGTETSADADDAANLLAASHDSKGLSS